MVKKKVVKRRVIKKIKMGRPFRYGKESEKHVVTLSLKVGVMRKLLKLAKTDIKSEAVTSAIEEFINA